jgi:hypothetical protein
MRAEGSSRGHVQVGARQRSRRRGPRLPWGPHPAALTRVPPSPTNSVGEGVYFGIGSASAGCGARAGAPHPQPFPRKLRGGREPVECATSAEARFRSPPPLRSGGRGPGGGGSRGMRRQPVDARPKFSSLPRSLRGRGRERGRPRRERQSGSSGAKSGRVSGCRPAVAPRFGSGSGLDPSARKVWSAGRCGVPAPQDDRRCARARG